jgi:nucleoside-diphosphate-sugar epimerase
MRILITGAAGCVGHYLVEDLLERSAHHLVLLLRDPARLAIPDRHRDRVTVVRGDLRDRAAWADHLAGVEAALLVATAWGGAETRAITVEANLALADALIAAGCGHILYFATASVLARDATLLPEARRHGTDYIASKHELVEAMEARGGGGTRITGLFPTLVFGGGGTPPAGFEPRPMSHLARLARQVRPWLWLIRRVTAEGRFHIIHAADIATVCRLLIEGAAPPAGAAPGAPGVARVVLGNPPLEVGGMIAELAAATGRRHRPLFRLTPANAGAFVRLFRIELTPWDRYLMQHPDQSYPGALCPAGLGAPMAMPSLTAGLHSIGIGR